MRVIVCLYVVLIPPIPTSPAVCLLSIHSLDAVPVISFTCGISEAFHCLKGTVIFFLRLRAPPEVRLSVGGCDELKALKKAFGPP